jgi:ferredoxin
MLKRVIKDETDQMDLKAGNWKSLVFSPPPEADTPTYEIAGPTEKYDCRDHSFARVAMKEGTPPYEDYYQRHPEKHEIDDKIRKKALTSGEKLVQNDPINERMAVSSFTRSWVMSRPDYLKHKASLKLVPVGRVKQEKISPNPEQMSRKIKALGLHLGAGRVRIAKLDQRWVYSHQAVPAYGEPYQLDYPTVVCLAVPQNPFFMASHTGLSHSWEVGWTYSYATFISYTIADYIRTLGWRARAIPTMNTPYLVSPLFVDCGIGEDGRCGYTVTKEFGNNWRPGGIATDLPLVADKPVDFGLQDFCKKCGICADTCPSGAISKGRREIVRGYKKWHIDADKCYKYWNTIGRPCGVCLSVCPWNHVNTPFHKGVRELVQKVPSLHTLLIKGEETFYSQNPKPDPKWMSENVNYSVIPDS